MFSSQLLQTAEYIINQNSRIPFVRKSIIIAANGCTGQSRFEQNTSTMFVILLKTFFQDYYKDIDTSNWYFQTSNWTLRDAVIGCIAKAAKVAMFSNITLPPVIVRAGKKTGLKIGHPIDRIEDCAPRLDFIVYIGKFDAVLQYCVIND